MHRNGVKMKKSIQLKMTGVLTVSILCIVLLCWILNRSFLENYYENSKINTIKATFDTVMELYKENNGELSYEELAELDGLCVNQNVTVYVFRSTDADVYFPSYPYFRQDIYDMEIAKSLYYQMYVSPNSYQKQLYHGIDLIEKTDDYKIVSYVNDRVSSDYLHLIGHVVEENGDIVNNYIVSICTTYQSMQESVTIANKFLAYVGTIVTIIGSIVMLFISRRFAKPITKLADIARSMSQLNFDAKYTGTTDDEINELGQCMNSLSDRLEETIGDLKSANNELKKDIERKNQLEEMRREFLSNVSHELKTPIALIQGYAEGLMENVNEDEESKDFYCEVIADEANKMNKIVQKLLTLNQIEFGNDNLNFERFDLVRLIKDTLHSTEILTQQKQTTVIFEETAPLYVWADESMVDEVLNNYISNAIHYVGGQNIIEVKLIRHDNVVRVAVFNTGDKIPEDEIEKIWIKFYKVDKARSREYGGSGVGLSIVKAIMDSLNQKYGVVNHETGVEFWFELDVK